MKTRFLMALIMALSIAGPSFAAQGTGGIGSAIANCSGDINAGCSAVNSVQAGATGTTPASGDSTTKLSTTQFVQYALAAFNPLASVNEATTTVLPNTPTYANGASGVGATLTAASNTTLTVDGVVVALNDRVLVKNQASAFQNGVYLCTAAGSGAAAWVLTRSTDYNTASNINSTGDVPVSAGNTLAGTLWLETATITTIGTDSLTFIQVAAAQGTGGGKGTTLAGDVTGKVNNNTVNAIQGVVITGAASNTKVLTATSATAATWSAAAGGGGGIFTHTISGANQTLVVNSASTPATDIENHLLSASTTDVLPAAAAVADGEVMQVKFIQPSGANNYTATISAGAGTTLVYDVQGGSCPTMPTATNSELYFDLVYITSLTEWDVVACPTNPSQAAAAVSLTTGVTGILPVANGGTNQAIGLPYAISAGNETYGSNSIYVTGQQVAAYKAAVGCHFTNLTCVNTFHAATCTTAPTVNVFDGAANIGTAVTCSATLQGTRGTVTTQAETQAVAAGDIYGIYISTQGGTCLTDQFTVTADMLCP